MLRGRSKRKADFILYYSNQVATFKPFKAVRPTSDKAHLVASRPYDVLNSSEAKIEAAGNEFSFMMQAIQNIELLKGYEIQKIVTGCPHCFNTLKNEYPELGGNFEVIHHTQLINQLIREGRLLLKDGGVFNGKKITFHDPCYLGRANDVYEAPRSVLEKLDAELAEMKRSKSNGLCCGAGGAQMFKEAEKGNKEINIERTEDALAVNPDIIATGCPFCNTMMTDGVKYFEKENEMKVVDIAELIAQAADL